jgi:hypothetical protein
MSKSVLMRRIEVVGTTPHRGDEEGTVTYKATFEITSDNAMQLMDFTVSTTEGFEVAVGLACQQLVEYANWLAAAAEEAKRGPHRLRLY